MTKEVTWGPCGEFWLENICSGAVVQNTFLGPPGPLAQQSVGRGAMSHSLSTINRLTGSDDWQLLYNG